MNLQLAKGKLTAVVLAGLAAVACALALFPSGTAGADTTPSSGTASGDALGPQVIRTGSKPTGYRVVFRYSNPSATNVLIKGTWSYSNEAKQASDPTNLNPVAAKDWKPGDFPLQSPDQPGEGWPVAQMTKDSDGTWSYSVPLASGWFDYQLYPNCAATPPSTTGCTAVADPANPTLTGCPDGSFSCTPSQYPWSEVYVPGDPAFGTEDLSWQTNSDLPASRHGTYANVSYPDSNSTSPVGSHNMIVYLPPGYDKHRRTPYPVFVLSHGGGENELAWINRGRALQILDHALAAHEMQPAVVVMTNGSGLSNPSANSRGSYVNDVDTAVLPYLESHYNVSEVPSGRAFAGTSAYGTQANIYLFGTSASGFTDAETTQFGYLGPWSPASGAPPITVTGQGPGPTAPQYQNPALLDLQGNDVTIGAYDLGGNAPMLTATTERQGLQNAGVPFRYYTTDGGHTWQFWRKALHDFLLNMAFKTTTTTATASTSAVTVTVTNATAEPKTPTGKVTLYNATTVVGSARLIDGTATISTSGLAGQTVTATYGGDRYYTVSSGAAVTVPAT